MIDLQPGQGALDDRQRAVMAEPGGAVGQPRMDIIDAGSGLHGGAPAAHAQAQAVYDLLDELRARHPDVEWESCAAGGGRIDLAMP